MARFKGGDLILNETKKVKIGSAEITDNGTQLQINKPLKVDGIQLNSGIEITSASTSVGADSTSTLIPSTTVIEKMGEATSTIVGGTDAVGVVTQPKPEIVSSQLIYGNGIEFDSELSGWDVTTLTPVDVYNSSITGTALKSGLIACFYMTNPDGLTVEYLTQDGTSINSLNILSGYGTTLEPRSFIAGALQGGGCIIEAATSNDDKAYLIGVNAGCDIVVTKELPYDISSYYTFGILPNDDIFIASSPDGVSLYWARYRLDLLDSTSFVTVTDWRDTGYDLSESSFSQGAFCRYLGENRIVIPVDSGFVLFNIQTKEVEATGTVSGVDDPYSICEITTDKKIMVFAPSSETNTLNEAVFTDTGIELENGIEVTTNYLGSNTPGTTILLPNGNVCLFFRTDKPSTAYYNVGYYIIDKQGQEVASGRIDLGNYYPNPFCSMLPDGKVLVQSYISEFSNYIINPSGIKLSKFNGLEFTSDAYPTINSLQTAATIQDATKYSNFPAKSPINIQGQIDGREVGDNWITSYAGYGPGTASNNFGYIPANAFPGLRKVGIFYCSTASKNDIRSGIIDLDTMEITTQDIGIPSGKTVESMNYKPLVTKNRYMLGYFEGDELFTSWVKLIDSDGNLLGTVEFDNIILGAGELENDEIIFLEYKNGVGYQVSRYMINIDSSSVLGHISTVSADSMSALSDFFSRIYDMGAGELLITVKNRYLHAIGVDGKIIRSKNLDSYFGSDRCCAVYLNNLIYAFGRDVTNGGATCVILDRDFDVLKTTNDPTIEISSSLKIYDSDILQNRTCLFTAQATLESVSNPYVFFVTPDGSFTYKKLPHVNGYPSGEYSNQPFICNLGNGEFITVAGWYSGYEKLTITFFEKEPLDDKLIFHKTIAPQSNYGAYDYRPVKYTKEIIFYDTGVDSEKKTIGVFNSGRIVLFENTGSKMVYSILKSDGTVVIDRADLFLGTYTSNSNTRIDGNDKRSVHSFNNISYVLATFEDYSTGQRVTIVMDDKGNQPCYPMMHLNNDTDMYGVSAGILEDDRIIITENSTSGYEMGDGQYLSMWQVNTDSSSFEMVIPRIKQFERWDESDLVQITKNRVVYYGSNRLSLLNTRNLGVTFTYDNPCSGRTVRNREIVVTPNKKIIIFCYTVNSSTDVDFYARIFRYDDYNEQLIYETETYLFKSQTEYDPISMVLNNDLTIAFYCTNINHIDPIASNRGKGILLMDETGVVLNADDYITQNNSSWITLPMLERGADGSLYVIKSGTNETVLEKWMPVITKESPFKSVSDVLLLTTETALTLDRTYLGRNIIKTSTGTLTVTIPADITVNDLPHGFQCSFARTSSGGVSFTTAGGVTLISAGSLTTLRVAGSSAKLIKIVGNTWLLTGDLA